MAIPEGYSFLAKLGISYKGDYSETDTYEQFNAVYYNGSTYIALVDSPAGPPTADGANWQYMAQGFLSQVISSLTATDKNGVIGEAGATVNAQNLIDGMSDDIKDKLDKTGDASDTIVTFEQASERTNIISGESHKTILGKIKKWFADMTAAAFAQIITSNTDLMATTVAGYLVDALAVKNQFDVVGNKIDETNSNLTPLVSTKLIFNSDSISIIRMGSAYCMKINDAKQSEVKSLLSEYTNSFKSNFIVSVMSARGVYYIGQVSKSLCIYFDSNGAYHEIDDTFYLYGTLVWVN